MKKIYFSLMVMLLASSICFGQLSGTKTIPGDYPTLKDAIDALNIGGVGAGGVTFQVGAAQSLTTTLQIGSAALSTGVTASSSANPVVIDGGNFTIDAAFAGTRTGGLTATTANDASIVINGTDFVTIKNFVFTQQASNTTTTTAIENAVAMHNRNAATPFDGCQNITIQGCTFNMGEVATGGAAVHIASNVYGGTTSLAWASYATSPGDMNREITVTNNTFSGYNFVNYNGATTANGRKLFVNNNTITDVGGAAVTAYGLYGKYLDSCTFSNNIVTMSPLQSTTGYLAFLSTNAGAYQEANANTITIQGSVTTSTLYGIYYTSVGAEKKMNNNTIQFGAFPSLTTGSVYGLYATYSGGNNNFTQEMNGNTCKDQVFPGSSGTTSSTVYLFYNVASTGTNRQVHLKNNTIINNSRSGGGTVYALYPGTADATDISGNTINNFTWTNNSASSSANFYGIYGNGSPVSQKIYNNTVSNISISGASTSTAGAIQGIRSSTLTTGTAEVYNNNVFGLTYGAGTHTGNVTGIYLGVSSLSVYTNKVYDLTANQALGTVYGFTVASGTPVVNIYNNLIGDLKAPAASATADAIRGVNITSTTATSTINLSFNTVRVAASSSGTDFSSSAIFHTTSATATTASLVMKNNIFVNTSTPKGAGFTVAYRRSSNVLTNYASASNNNLFYAGTPGAANLIFYDGTNADQLMSNFKARVSPADASSIAENLTFVSLNGADATFLHLNTTIPTQVESGGIAVAGITTDFDGDTRNVATPDIGADEFSGISADLTPPSMIFTPLSFTCSNGARTLSVSITDASGVPTTGVGRPVLYWKINSAASWTAVTGTYTSGSNYDFSFGGGVVASDSISYYIVAQDNAGTPNVGASHAGASGLTINPPAASVAPTSPGWYKISGSLSGTYTVGASGVYPTLTAAVNAYNNSCLTGPVVFSLTDASYSGAETFPITINVNPYASAVNTLTIKPASGNAATITGTSGASVGSLIRLNGSKYVIFDGVNAGGSSLTIENTSATTGTAVIWISSNGVGAGANNNTIKNCSIKGGIAQNGSALVTYGVVVAGSTLSATITSITGGDDNDNTIITGNTFTKLRYGIFTRGGSTTNLNTGTVISNNVIGSTSFGTEQIGRGGIIVREEDGIIISGNEIMFVGGDYANTTGGTDRTGIAFSTDALWTPTAVLVKNAVVTRNNIHDIVDERTFSAVGISIGVADGTNATNNLFANNMISNLKANGTSTDQAVGIGISAGNGDKIVFNSISLTGDTDPNASATSPSQSNFGIRISATAVTNISVLNNIIVNDLSSSSASTIKNACIDLPASFVWGTGSLNNNDLYVNPGNTQSYIGSIGNTTGTFQSTLSGWQTATSQEANSVSTAPVFNGVTDLHLVPVSNVGLNALGTPVAGVTTDYDNDTRNATNPDMGADEFNLPAGIDMKASSLVLPVAKSCFGTAETVTIKVQNASGSTIDFSVNPLTVNTTVSGAVSANLSAVVNTGTLASGVTLDVPMSTTLNMSTVGVYTFNASVSLTGDSDPTNNAMPPVSRTAAALAPGTVSSNVASYCAIGGKPILTIAGNSGVGTVQWQESTTSAAGPWANVGTNASTYTPGSAIVATTWYQAALSCNASNATSNVVMVEFNNPQVLTTPAAARCGTGPVTLTATAAPGNTLNWYAASTGGNSLATGNSFTTPSISNTTNFYVAASTGYTSTSLGPVSPSSLGTVSSSTIVIGTQAMYFDVLGASATISTVDIYPTAAVGSNFSIVIRNSGGTDIYTSPTFTTTVTGGTTPQTVTLNATVPTGTAYKIGMGINPGLQRNTTGAVYPYTIPGIISFTGNTFDPVYWYWFYNINIQSGCEGVRTLVPATVNPASGTLAGTIGGAQVCQSAIVATGNTYYDNSCNLIAAVTPAGPVPVNGSVSTCVKIDATVQTYGGQPYVQRHYDITPATNAANATGAITMYFLQSEFDAYNLVRGIYPPLPTGPADAAGISNIRITQFHGVGTAPGNYSGTVAYIDSTSGNIAWDAANSRWTISIAINGFSGFYLHTGSGALPVSIAELKGIRNGNLNQLSWKTLTETNNRGFYIERSADGRSFTSLGFVESKAAGGNSTAAIDYRFDDAVALSGGNYYRLKQVDKDGKMSYSNMVLIKGVKPVQLTLSNLYPNPARDVVRLSIESPLTNDVTVVITDVSGKVVKQKASRIIVGDNIIDMNLAALAPGTYMVKLVCPNGCETAYRKFTKQ